MTQYHGNDTQPAGFPAAPLATTPPVTPPTTTSPTTADSGPDDSSGRATQAADAGKQAVQDVASTATDKAKDVANETKKQAKDVLGEARTQFQDQAATQHQNAVSGLKSLATQLKSMSDNADADGPATGLVAQAGDRVHSAASWLEDREPGQLVDEVRDLARRRPAAFLVGALVAGVVAGRLTRGVVDEHRDDSTGAVAADHSARSDSGDVLTGYTPTHETPYGTADSGSAVTADPIIADRVAPEISVPDQFSTPGYGVPSTPRNPA